MASETYLSVRKLENERLISYFIIAAGLLLLIFFVLLQLIFKEMAIRLLVFFVSGSLILFALGFFNLRENDYLINVILSEDHLKIVMENHKSENTVDKIDWKSIKDLTLREGFEFSRNRGDSKLSLRYISSFTNELNVKVFPLRKYNSEPKKQRLLFERINEFWENSQNEMKNLIIRDNETLFNCQICLEYHKNSSQHYICEICSRMLCFSCYLTCKSVEKTSCPNCGGNLTLNPT